MAATWASKCNYSPDASSLAISSPDGRLTIWDTVAGTPKQQYTPSSHLSVTCTCLAWCPSRQQTSPVRKRKKTRRQRSNSTGSDVGPPNTSPEIIALGTIAGHVMLYSVAKGDVHCQMSGGHDDKINDVSWHPTEDVLYSASDDQQIVEWHIPTKSVKCKWKADKNAVHCVCVCPGGKTILSAGRTIQLWDLETKRVLKRFVGHASPVSRLRVAITDSSIPGGGDGLNSIEGLYFLSSAIADRVLNMWQVRSSSKDKTAMASFSVLEDPVQYDVCCTQDQTLYLAVLTNDGQVHIFDPILNGRSKKPLSPRHTIQISTAGDKHNTPRPIPILAVQFVNDSEVIIAHGTFLKMVFERIPFLSKDKAICLVRDDPAKSRLQVDISADKVKKPLTSVDAAVHGPSTLAPAPGPAAKRRRTKDELTMADRINALSIAQAQPISDQTKVPTSGTLVQLLTQGLQSQDKDMLERVFCHQKESVISATIRRLPVPLVIPLVQELITRMNTTPQRGLLYALWVKCTLREHTSYLMAVPELLQKLNTVYEMVHARTRTGGQLRRLQGKLSLMLAQIQSQAQKPESQIGAGKAEALLVYQEDSSDEGADLEEPLPIHSESEGEWEELSESEVEDQTNVREGDGNEDDAAESDEESSDEESSSMEAEEEEDQELTDPSSSSDNEDE